jgi:hypothetical protein
MTEPGAGRRPRRSQRTAVLVHLGALVAFAAVLGLLSWRVAAGADPAIGAGAQSAAPAAERVLVRRVVRHVVVTHDRRAELPVQSAPAPAPAVVAPSAPPPTTRAS